MHNQKTLFQKYVETYNVNHIYLQKEWTEEEVSIENAVKSKLKNRKLAFIYNQFLYHPEDINFDISEIPQVFTNFRKSVEKYLNSEQS